MKCANCGRDGGPNLYDTCMSCMQIINAEDRQTVFNAFMGILFGVIGGGALWILSIGIFIIWGG